MSRLGAAIILLLYLWAWVIAPWPMLVIHIIILIVASNMNPSNLPPGVSPEMMDRECGNEDEDDEE